MIASVLRRSLCASFGGTAYCLAPSLSIVRAPLYCTLGNNLKPALSHHLNIHLHFRAKFYLELEELHGTQYFVLAEAMCYTNFHPVVNANLERDTPKNFQRGGVWRRQNARMGRVVRRQPF